MLSKLIKNKKGFTLIELIVVIAVLVILAAIAIPTYIGITQSAEDKVALSNAVILCNAYNTYQQLYPDQMFSEDAQETPQPEQSVLPLLR